MFSTIELESLRRHAEHKRDGFLETHPEVQVPPDEGPQTLRLVDEIERLYALAGLMVDPALPN